MSELMSSVVSRHDPSATVTNVTQCIQFLRGHRILLDRDLAVLYQVQTKVLVQAVKRNLDRFPQDFMFQLTMEEAKALSPPRSQTVTLNASARGRNIKYAPYAFTEQGVAMLSSVLRSKRAILVNIEVMRAFVRLREILAGNRALARKLAKAREEV